MRECCNMALSQDYVTEHVCCKRKHTNTLQYHIALHRTVKNAKCMSSNRASHCPGELQKRACSRYERRSTRPPTASGKACAPGTVQYSTVQYSTVEYSTVHGFCMFRCLVSPILHSVKVSTAVFFVYSIHILYLAQGNLLFVQYPLIVWPHA